MDGDESAEELGTEALSNDNDSPYDHESWVREDSIEDVYLVINLSGANHVENLHEYEQIKYDGKMARWSCSFKHFVHWFLSLILDHTH